MLPEERRRRILRALEAAALVRVTDLANQLGVSIETIRRDIVALDHEGLVRRVYGGIARNANQPAEPPYERRRNLHLAAKRAMARLAVTLVEPGETLIFDVGTSIVEVAAALPSDFSGRALTNSLYVAQELATRAGMAVHIAAGQLRAEDLAVSGPLTETFFESFYADRAFLGSGGVNVTAGLTDYHPNEVAVRQTMLRHVSEAYVLADSSKLGRVALQHVCPLSDLAGIITDSQASPDTVAQMRQQGARVLIADVDSAAEPCAASA